MDDPFVLVVDDNADVREALCEFIRAWDVHCEGAANGRAALDLSTRGPAPVLVLLDLDMPVMNGWEFLERVAENPRLRRIPVAVLSAVACFQRESLRGRPFFTKPIDEEDLRRLVHSAIALRKRDPDARAAPGVRSQDAVRVAS